MLYDRATFLSKAARAALAAVTMPSLNKWKIPPRLFVRKDFGIQLWSVRQEMARNARPTLAALASYGYTQIESFGDGDPGNMFWGMKPEALKSFLDGIGLNLVSAHCDADYTLNFARRDEFKKLADTAAGIRMKYLINPFMVQLKTIDAFKRASEQFNKQGEICKNAGLRFGYHNHNYSFKKIDGLYPQDVMMLETDPSLVDFEMDIYWVVDAGEDPENWLKKYPDRFRLCHIKDHYSDEITASLVKKETPEEPELGLNVSCDLGKGKINYPEILKTAMANGVKYFFVEQERYDLHNPMDSAEINASYMKALFSKLP